MKKYIIITLSCILTLHSFSQKGKTTTEYYYKELKKAEGKVDKEGKKTGEWTFWDIKGRICDKRIYKDGKLNGEVLTEREFYTPSNEKLEELKKDENLYSVALKRQSNSKLDTISIKSNYVDDKKNGLTTYFDLKGIRRTENYKDGYLNGVTTRYENSKITSENFYTLGNQDSSIYYENDEKRVYINKKEGGYNAYYKNNVLYKTETRSKNGNDFKIKTCHFAEDKTVKCDSIMRDLRFEDEYGNKYNYEIVIPETKTEKVEVDEIFDVVEESPQYPGGQEAMYKFIGTNFVIDTTVVKGKVGGKIYVSFVVDKDGSVTDVKILRGMSKPLDDEAMRVVRMMPKWIPGKQRGIVVKVRYNLPIVVKNY